MIKSTNRRTFIRNSVIASAGISLIGCKTSPTEQSGEAKKVKPLKILILGGTSFLGPHQIAYALGRGHTITTFTRGKTKPSVHGDLFVQVEMLIGDRVDNLEALKGRQWDVVIDNSGRQVQWTKDTAELLKDKAKLYVYISSDSVYYPYYTLNVKEDQDLVLEIPGDIDEKERGSYSYGVMKANSEIAAKNAFGADRTLVIRPTYLMGPGDRTNRFIYWALQLANGGDLLVPGITGEPVQYIDIRDMASWMIRLIENQSVGTFNGSGPKGGASLADFVREAGKAFDAPVNEVHINDIAFLNKQGISFMAPWVSPTPEYAGVSRVNFDKAISSGVTYRPLSETMMDIYNWWSSDAVDEERKIKFLTDPKGIFMKAPEVIKNWQKLKGK